MSTQSAQTEAPKLPPLDSLADLDLLLEASAAHYLEITSKTLQNWRCTGRYALPYVKIGGRVRYRAGDLKKFIERRLRNHTGEAA